MKFITVRDLRSKPAEIWRDLPEVREMVITNNGHPIALLTPIAEDNLEENLKVIRKARAIEAMRVMQNHSMKSGLYNLSDSEIQKEIIESRKELND